MFHEDPYKDIDDIEKLEVELEPRPLWQRMLLRTFQVIVGLAVIVGLIYLSGFKQFFFYRRTPENIEVKQMESVLRVEQIKVPVVANIVRVENSNKGSDRTEQGIRKLVKQSNKVWAQADIKLELKEVREITIRKKNLEEISDFPLKVNKVKENAVNAYFIGSLEGPSGLAYSSTVLVADYTTAHDYLVFAHEVGHVLGLDHVKSHDRLMFSEGGGSHLSKQEVKTARSRAKRISTNE